MERFEILIDDEKYSKNWNTIYDKFTSNHIEYIIYLINKYKISPVFKNQRIQVYDNLKNEWIYLANSEKTSIDKISKMLETL